MTRFNKFLLAGAVALVAALAYAQTATYFPRIAAGARPDTMVVNGTTITSQVEVNSDTQAIVESHTHTATAGNGAIVYGARSRGTSASPAIVQNGDQLFALSAVGFDGTDYAVGAAIAATVGGVPGNNDMPGSWAFCTTADGASTPANCFTEDSNGKLNTLASSTTSAGLALPHGAAPTSPVNGDLWTTTSGLFARINGATVGPYSATAGVTQTTGSFAIDWNNACSTTPTTTFNYVVTGKTVTVSPAAQISCTGDSVSFNNSGSGTSVTAAIRPAVTSCFPVTATDNGTDTPAFLQVTTAGLMFIAKSTTNCTSGNFTASGTRNFPADNSTVPTFTWQIP